MVPRDDPRCVRASAAASAENTSDTCLHSTVPPMEHDLDPAPSFDKPGARGRVVAADSSLGRRCPSRLSQRTPGPSAVWKPNRRRRGSSAALTRFPVQMAPAVIGPPASIPETLELSPCSRDQPAISLASPIPVQQRSMSHLQNLSGTPPSAPGSPPHSTTPPILSRAHSNIASTLT